MAASTTLRIAWRNLGRNRKRSALALLAIAIGQFVFLAVAGLMHGYMDVLQESITGPMVGHAQVHAPGWLDDRSLDVTVDGVSVVLEELRADASVANAAARVYAPVLAALTEEGFMSIVVGVDPAVETHDDGLIPGLSDAQLGGGQVLAGRNFAQRYGIAPGDELALVGQDIDGSIASGLFEVTEVIESPVELVSNLGIVMSLTDASELLAMHDQAHEIVIHTTDVNTIAETVERLRTLPALAGLEILRWEEAVPQLVGLFAMVDSFLIVVLLIVFVAAAAGIANTMLMSTYERKHEFGMLLSLGCAPNRLSRLVTVEAVLLGLTGVALGTVLGIILTVVTARTGLDYAAFGGGSGETYEAAFRGLQMSSLVHPRLYVSDVLSGVVAVFLTSLLSVIWPVVRISRLEPMEAMRL